MYTSVKVKVNIKEVIGKASLTFDTSIGAKANTRLEPVGPQITLSQTEQ